MSANRYSALNRRPAATSSLFEGYPGTASSRPSSSTSHGRPGGGVGGGVTTGGGLGGSGGPSAYGNYSSNSPRPASPYNNNNNSNSTNPYANGSSPSLISSPYSTSTPNTNSTESYSTKDKPPKHFSASVLDSLESQNETTQTSLLSSKVAQLKTLTIAIGDEIRDSSSLASQINDQFEGAGTRLKGTMRRMMRMADSTGVGWRVWLLFFAAVWLIFVYVWLF